MLAVVSITIFGMSGIAFLLWCLYHFHMEVSRPHSVRITKFSTSRTSSRAEVIELPKQSARQQVLAEESKYRG